MALPLTTEPRDLLLDNTNDIIVTTDLQLSSGIGAVVQSCRIAMQMFANEWFLDLDAGIKYWEEILARKPKFAVPAALSEFRRELSLVNGVLKITKLEVTFDGPTRTMFVKWRVLTGYGETPVDTIKLEIGV